MRTILGISCVLYPYTLLASYAEWAWLNWLLYYICALALVVGWKSRVVCPLLACLLFVHSDPVGLTPSPLQLQGYALAWFCGLMTLLPSDVSFSLYRYYHQYKGEKMPRERANVWAVRLFQVQTSVFLLSDSLSRLSPSFISGERVEQLILLNLAQSDPTPLIKYTSVTALIGIGSLVLPAVGAVLVWIPRTYLAGVACVLGYGLLLQLMLPGSIWFLLLLLGLLSFVDPAKFHQIPDALREKQNPQA